MHETSHYIKQHMATKEYNKVAMAFASQPACPNAKTTLGLPGTRSVGMVVQVAID